MIKISGLNKKFNTGTFNEVYALNNINLTVNEGDFVTIIGTNGSGKTTLLNAIAGVFLPDDGKIEIFGKDVTKFPDFKRAGLIARVFQNPFTGTAADLSIAQNMHLATLRGKIRKPLIKFTKNSLDFYKQNLSQLEMNLEDRLSNKIGSLSGGQRQAITLLMAVLNKPKILLLDEHTAALDPKSAANIINLTNQFIIRDKLTTIMVTHSLQQALEYGNRTILMHKGRIVEEISGVEKKYMNVKDLYNLINDLKKQDILTDEIIENFRKEYD